MKKLILSFSLLLSGLTVFAQYNSSISVNNATLTFKSSGTYTKVEFVTSNYKYIIFRK
ncbi:MAG: hypothetical protein R6V23_01960 [Bacteroidales bacterium]